MCQPMKRSAEPNTSPHVRANRDNPLPASAYCRFGSPSGSQHKSIVWVRCWRFCRGPQGLAGRERSAKNLGGPMDSWQQVGPPKHTEGG